MIYDIAKGLNHNLPPYHAFKRTSYFKRFITNSLIFSEFVTKYINPETRIYKQKAYTVLIKMIQRYIENIKLNVSPKTLTDFMGKIKKITKKQFPNYIENDFLKRIITGNRK